MPCIGVRQIGHLPAKLVDDGLIGDGQLGDEFAAVNHDAFAMVWFLFL